MHWERYPIENYAQEKAGKITQKLNIENRSTYTHIKTANT
jgi:hypothetical protein